MDSIRKNKGFNNSFCLGIAVTYLVIMCTQYIPLEGWTVSPIKVSLMCLSPLLWLVTRPHLSKAVLLGGLYLLWCFGDMYLRFSNPRLETMGYSAMFFSTYFLFYELVYYKKVFTTDGFLRLMRVLIWSYTIVLIVQQMLSLTGFPIVEWCNLYWHHTTMKCQSLSIEPSHSARILGAVGYAFLKLNEYKNGEKISIQWLWSNERSLLVGFLYAMLSMQSGTAIWVLMILFFYFFHWKYILLFVVFLILLPFVQLIVQSEQIQRVVDVITAVFSGDISEVITADRSASFRIVPMLNMFNLNFSDIYTWIGHGTDTAASLATEDIANVGALSENVVHNGILDYGFFSYILGLCFVFCCCIKPVFCLATFMFFTGVGGSFGNVAYGWGILMIFTVVGYFKTAKTKDYLRTGSGVE